MRCRSLPYKLACPDLYFLHCAIFHPNTPPPPPPQLVFLNPQTLANRFYHFRADFEKFQEMCEHLNYQKFYLIAKTPRFCTKEFLESPLEVFLTGEPNTNKKNSY